MSGCSWKWSRYSEKALKQDVFQLTPRLALEVAFWGPRPPAPQIILLHEGLGSIAEWRDFPQKLSSATGFGVVAYSREGYGRSSPLKKLDDLRYLHEEARCVSMMLDTLNIEKAYLFGHSDGGSIAILAAALLSERVLSVFVEAPHLYVEPETVRAVEAAGKAWETGSLRKALERQHDDPAPIFHRWHNLWTSKAFAESFNIVPELERIGCEIIAVQGTEDMFASPRQLEDIEKRAVRGRSIWIENCGHAPHREAPERVLTLVKKWLDI
ncbi:alpha/beta hydrolase [Brucella sp. 10RB9213]|uniref:alpha/beta fold hydrolase n=1 Tax=Brucella sp. 10RB9213 TaxID=1844039 RepID=UPI00316AE96D